MSHVRQQIRAAVVAAVTGLPATGANVILARSYPVDTDPLPGLAVYAAREPVRVIDGQRRQLRDLELVIDAYAETGPGFDDELDQICAEVEAAVAGASGLGALAFDAGLAETAVQIAEAGDHGIARLRFVIRYQTNEGAPEVAL